MPTRTTPGKKWIYILPSNSRTFKIIRLLVSELAQVKYVTPAFNNPPSFTQNLVFSRCCCTENGKEMFEDLTHVHSHCSTHWTFSLWRSRCLCFRGLLEYQTEEVWNIPRIFNNVSTKRITDSSSIFPETSQEKFPLWNFWG